MIEHNVKQFFDIATERYRMMKLRQAGRPSPWTEDPILHKYRFCNTFREDDKTTIWFKNNARGFLQHRPADVILATVAFRWFNRIETGHKIQHLLTYGTWSSEHARKILTGVTPVVTGAYIIKTPNGMTKLEGVLQCIDNVHRDIPEMVAHLDKEVTLEGFWEVLRGFPFLGPFMAYQIVSDLIHTDVLKDASDRMTWACPGPGSLRGVSWLVFDHPDGRINTATALGVFRGMLGEVKKYWPPPEPPFKGFLVHMPEKYPKWEMQSIQHWACEMDKYRRALGGQAMKRNYP